MRFQWENNFVPDALMNRVGIVIPWFHLSRNKNENIELISVYWEPRWVVLRRAHEVLVYACQLSLIRHLNISKDKQMYLYTFTCPLKFLIFLHNCTLYFSFPNHFFEIFYVLYSYFITKIITRDYRFIGPVRKVYSKLQLNNQQYKYLSCHECVSKKFVHSKQLVRFKIIIVTKGLIK